VPKYRKYAKKAKKCKKYAKIFAHIKKLYYLCTVIQKQLTINPGGNGSQAAKRHENNN